MSLERLVWNLLQQPQQEDGEEMERRLVLEIFRGLKYENFVEQ